MKLSQLKFHHVGETTLAVVAPAYSLSFISPEIQENARCYLMSLGFRVCVMPRAYEVLTQNAASLESRLNDLHEAYADSDIDALITSIGGYSSLDLLDQLDFSLIEQNPKPIIGYSDITALQNIIYHRTGVQNFSGPHFSSFGMKKGVAEIGERFVRAVFNDKPFLLEPSHSWSCDEWFLDQDHRTYHTNPGHLTVCSGDAEGVLIGGNLETLVSLAQQELALDYAQKIILLEDLSSTSTTFLQKMDILRQNTNFVQAKALLIGRFQRSDVEQEVVRALRSQNELSVPIVSGLDFGHTTPLATLPIGGMAKISATPASSEIWIHR